MITFLFIVYFLAGCFFLPRIKFIKDAGLSRSVIIGLFTVKVAVGCLLGLVNHFLLHNYTDYDSYNQLGIAEHHNLFADPHRFFTDIFRSNYAEYGDYFGSSGSYWNDLRTNIIFKVLGLMDIFSHGNYYINALFFNFCCFFGHAALYRIFNNLFPGKKIAVIIGCFLLPSMLYFSSGIHKDPVIFTALAFFCYAMFFSLDCGFSAKRILVLIVSFLVILLIRNFVAAILFPFATAWLISSVCNLKPAKIFFFTIALSACFFLLLHFGFDKYDPLKIVVAKQQSFLMLGKASSQYNNDSLAPTIKSFLIHAPTALRHAYLSPFPGEFKTWNSNLFSIEVLGYIACFILMFRFPYKERTVLNSFLFFCFTFTFCIFLFIGYVTPAAGALVRYRSIYFPLIITPVLCSINWEKLSGKFNILF